MKILTENEKRQIDQEVLDILIEIKESGEPEQTQMIMAFQAGVKFWEQKSQPLDKDF